MSTNQQSKGSPFRPMQTLQACLSRSQLTDIEHMYNYICQEAVAYNCEVQPTYCTNIDIAYLKEKNNTEYFVLSSATANNGYRIYLNDIRSENSYLAANLVIDGSLCSQIRQIWPADKYVLNSTILIGNITKKFKPSSELRFSQNMSQKNFEISLSARNLHLYDNELETSNQLCKLGTIASFLSPDMTGSLDNILGSLRSKNSYSATVDLLNSAMNLNEQEQRFIANSAKPEVSATPTKAGDNIIQPVVAQPAGPQRQDPLPAPVFSSTPGNDQDRKETVLLDTPLHRLMTGNLSNAPQAGNQSHVPHSSPEVAAIGQQLLNSASSAQSSAQSSDLYLNLLTHHQYQTPQATMYQGGQGGLPSQIYPQLATAPGYQQLPGAHNFVVPQHGVNAALLEAAARLDPNTMTGPAGREQPQ